MTPESICTKGSRVDYYWRECVNGNHIKETVEFLMDILKKEYYFNLHTEAHTEAQFEHFLDLATKGKLKPIDHVKRIASDPELNMFEIRWNDISVRKADQVSGLFSDEETVLMRLYYFDLDNSTVIGMHAHKKRIGNSDKETATYQNQEIDHASKHFSARRDKCWGISELSEREIALPGQAKRSASKTVTSQQQ